MLLKIPELEIHISADNAHGMVPDPDWPSIGVYTHTWVLGLVLVFGETENETWKFKRWPAAQPLDGHEAGEERTSSSAAALMMPIEKNKMAVTAMASNEIIQMNLRIG